MIYKFLLALADKPTPQFPEKFLRLLDRYTRKGKHHDAPGRPTGWAMTAWLRRRNERWQEELERHGIQAAIALGY